MVVCAQRGSMSGICLHGRDILITTRCRYVNVMYEFGCLLSALMLDLCWTKGKGYSCNRKSLSLIEPLCNLQVFQRLKMSLS